FASAVFLRRRGAPLVSGGIEGLGGALLPIVLFASFVDDAGFPPDLHGGPLVAAVAITSACLALAYAWWAARVHGSALRFLVAPMVWTAALGLGLAWHAA